MTTLEDEIDRRLVALKEYSVESWVILLIKNFSGLGQVKQIIQLPKKQFTEPWVEVHYPNKGPEDIIAIKMIVTRMFDRDLNQIKPKNKELIFCACSEITLLKPEYFKVQQLYLDKLQDNLIEARQITNDPI
jgi:hypothetical protein